MSRLFGTDGIRGRANDFPMDGPTAFKVGRAAAAFFNSDAEARHIVIGRDTRISGDMLAQAVGAGICSAGLDVHHLGVLPTPAVAHATRQSGAAAGIVISASHNPFDDNGIKLFNSNGCKLSDQDEDRIEAMMQPDQANDIPIGAHQIGRMVNQDEAAGLYVQFLLDSTPDISMRSLSIVLDCANGATYQTAPQLFDSLGASTTVLHSEPDGININDQCGSQHPEVMAQKVVEQKADLGLAFDGDGDRLIAVDERGGVLSGDQIMAICAQDMKQKGILSNNLVVSTVMSNLGFGKALARMGIDVVAAQVGDRYVMEKMVELGAVLGGEDSGHLIFRDKHTTGDGLMAAFRLIEAMLSAESSLSELSQIMTRYPQELINVDVANKPDLKTIPAVVEAIEQVESELGDQGRVLVRYSGTQLKCRVMVEGPTAQQTGAYALQIAEVVRTELA